MREEGNMSPIRQPTVPQSGHELKMKLVATAIHLINFLTYIGMKRNKLIQLGKVPMLKSV